ncbi:MAG: enoyl-CoA hydratase/isomerase family protein, partial [Deltaproteobacteria bacterium]|nr:enoyl-CoA hydratase/isomerase family protein [Deltaproteobacteria bacterium]
SSFYVREFAEKTSRPDRFVGLHYFFHPAKNRLLEVIPHAETSPETVAKANLFAKLHGKTAIAVKDTPGFAVNRFFVPFLNEAARMLAEDMANIATIEAAAKQAFKIGMGAFELMNVTGIPIAVHSADTLGRELGPFYATSETLRAQMESGENWDLSGEVDESKIEAVSDRFLGVCLGVAATLVDEGVASIEDTDRGAKIGLRWIQGPFEIMNRIGIEKTHALVAAACNIYPDFKMPEILEKQKAFGRPFEFKVVDLETKGPIAFITINRPEAMNSLNEVVVAQLAEKFDQAEANPAVSAIVFQGAGKAFVAGADIRFFVKKIKSDRIVDIETFTRKGHELLLKIENSKKRTIALLDGLSLGGGSELALACQDILATPAASMGFPETGIGIVPGLGGMFRLARFTGPALAKYFVFTGAPISAQDALDLGIIAKIVAPMDVDAALMDMIADGRKAQQPEVKHPTKFTPYANAFTGENLDNLLSGAPPAGISEEIADRIVKSVKHKAPIALRMASDIIDQQVGLPVVDAIEVELSQLKAIFSTADALEGLSSLGRKRPEYKGV